MEKILVLTEVFSIQSSGFGCKFLNKDAYKVTCGNKLYLEKEISEKLSELSDKGFAFVDERIFEHNLYVGNEFSRTGLHGAYRYVQTQPGVKYKAYFGPMILLAEEKKKGCKSISLGCKLKKIGCKLSNLGCKSEGGDVQYLNFYDDTINEEIVRKLNAHFKIDKTGYVRQDDYRYDTVGFENILSDIVTKNYDKLLAQYIDDVNKITSQGYGFQQSIKIPTECSMLKEALLFSNASSNNVTFATPDAALQHTTYLHRFDLWYFPRVTGLLRTIWEGFLKLLHLYKEKVIFDTTIINDENTERLEEIYTNDLNEQINERELVKSNVADVVTRIPVTIAIQKRQGWWRRLWYSKEYEYLTFSVNGVKA